jgi:hypothetical protein
MLSRFRSKLKQAGMTAKVLGAIKGKHLVFEISGVRIHARDCTNVAIDELAADDNIVFRRPGAGANEYYDLADVKMIRRIRSRKWVIQINPAADPAQATP